VASINRVIFRCGVVAVIKMDLKEALRVYFEESKEGLSP